MWRVGIINSGELKLDGFSQNEGFGEAILREPFDDAEAPNLAYNDITKPEEWWGWARGSLFDALYSDTPTWSSGGEEFELGTGNFINGYGLIMTPIRMTQWRSETMACTKLDGRIAESAGIDKCFKGYSDTWLFGYLDFDADSTMKDQSSFGPNQEFTYRQKGDESSSPFRKFDGRFGVYGEGGFIEILSPNATVANATLEYLERNKWIDGATRAVRCEPHRPPSTIHHPPSINRRYIINRRLACPNNTPCNTPSQILVSYRPSNAGTRRVWSQPRE